MPKGFVPRLTLSRQMLSCLLFSFSCFINLCCLYLYFLFISDILHPHRQTFAPRYRYQKLFFIFQLTALFHAERLFKMGDLPRSIFFYFVKSNAPEWRQFEIIEFILFITLFTFSDSRICNLLRQSKITFSASVSHYAFHYQSFY